MRKRSDDFTQSIDRTFASGLLRHGDGDGHRVDCVPAARSALDRGRAPLGQRRLTNATTVTASVQSASTLTVGFVVVEYW